ncbi:MAG TPA: 3-oxoadipate enol-lactonase [Thermoleophilaceae bacterium]
MTVDLHHEIAGPEDAPVLVLAGSLGTNLGMWDEQAEPLAERFRVLRYDQRGHGRSPVPPGPYAIADLAGDLIALMDRLGIERASFCGLSIGGMTGMWLGVHEPGRFERLVLCCTAPQLPPASQWAERAALVRAEGLGPVVDAGLERWFTPALGESRPYVLERFRAMMLATPPEGYAACCEAIGSHDMREEVGAITAPTLVIGGDGDPVAPPETTRALAAAIPGATAVVLEEARHLANAEQPDAFTHAVLQHLTAQVST